MPRWLRGSSLVVLLLALCMQVYAQRDLGTLTGTVTDPSGAAVPGAKITLTNQQTGVTSDTVSTGTGSYTRPALPPGTYTLRVEASGFQASQQTGVEIIPGQTVSANFALQVGSTNQTIDVTESAPLLQTETPAVSTTLSATEVSELPVAGQRTFTYLARLTPGVVVAEPGARDAAGGGFSANGVRSTGENNFLLNGVDNNVNVIDFINQTSFVIGPALDAIAETQVITNGASAEYGRAAGGIMEVNIKSGTNQVHGSLWEYLQNTDLDANRWENNHGAGLARPKLNQNQFGGAAGGPILKNRLFMFGDYQGTRIATAGGVIQNLGFGPNYTIPTPAMRGGDFSGLLGAQVGTAFDRNGNTIPVFKNQIFDPSTTTCLSGCAPGTLTPLAGTSPVYGRDPFPNNVIPVNRFDPVAAKLMTLYPNVNNPAAVVQGAQPTNDFLTQTAGAYHQDQGDGRVDYHLNDNNAIFGSISWSDTAKSSVSPFAGALDGANFYGTSETDLARDAVLSWTHIFSPTVVNEARVGFSRLVTARTQGNANTDEYKAFGIQGYDPTTTLNGGLPQFGLGHYSQVGANDWLPTREYSNEWDFIENLSLIRGNHSYKFGAEFRPLQFPFFQVPYPHGEMNFSRTETAAAANGFTGNTGDEIASFLLGAVDNGQISTTNFISSIKQAYAFYAQDTWKVTPKLTLNLGLRYELFSPIGEKFGRQSNFDFQNLTLYIPKGRNQDAPLPPNFNAPATVNGVTFPALFTTPITISRGKVSKYLIPWDKTDIGPRLGFAYNVREKTVVRGFFGIFYGGEENQGGNPNRGESAPFNESPQLNRPAGVSAFQPDPFFAGGAATNGIVGGYPVNVFNGFPVSSLQFRSVAQDFRNPMVQEWNLSVQQQLPANMALEIGYLGNHQAHQLLQPDFNACPNVFTGNGAVNCNSLRRIPDIGAISGTATFGIGNYNALTAQLQKRYSNGLQFVGSYTYGHALANSGTTLSGSGGLYTRDPLNYNTSYSSASWDIRHNFTLGFVYDVPFGRGRAYGANMNRALQTVLGNWQLNGILTLHTGHPYTLRDNACQGVYSGCSPDLVTGGADDAPQGGRRPSEWFDVTHVAEVPKSQFRQGTLGLQTNTAPPLRSLDFSIFKDFPITESMKFQFRGEAFNLANTPQFNTPDNNVQDANFGQITSTQAGSERHIQFALRFMF